jgi:hypothetical protein
MGLRERLRRLELEAELGESPAWDEYWAAARRERGRRLGAVYDRLVRIGGYPTPHPGRDGWESLLAGDTRERAEADRRVVARWEEAHGTADLNVAADAARAKLLEARE